ncbi:hypothetical protein BH11VER1_BH11VER1_29780 [soil metagenome]
MSGLSYRIKGCRFTQPLANGLDGSAILISLSTSDVAFLQKQKTGTRP